MEESRYPVQFSVDYPERDLNRLTTALRLIWIIPIGIMLSMVSGESYSWTYTTDPEVGDTTIKIVTGAGGLLFLPPLIMIVVRQKYPRWWFNWNLELQRFSNRVGTYLALMNDEYPSTDEEQWAHLHYDYPNVEQDLSRWMPLVKWLLAIPHYIVLFFLGIGAFVAVVIAWFAILITGNYPRGLFDFVEGVFRWSNRVIGYSFTLVTDEYPPFSLSR